MTIEEAGEYLVFEWSRIRQELLTGSYRPKLIRRVEIDKPGGGKRLLGIPTVVDRLIQQCILQILQPEWDSTFHEHSYGFRPGKSAHQAVSQAQSYVQSGRRFVVDVDLEKFFDRVNHDILMDRVARRVKDGRLVRVIRRYLQAGIMDQGVCSERHEGTPQGGPLSPLLANLLLDEVDRELGRRGLAFCRYADDCNVYVRSRRAAEDAMKTLTKLMGRLKLRINPEKSAIGRAWERKFLGYRLWIGPKREVKRAVAPEALTRFKQRVRELTSRACGRSMKQIVERLDGYLRGWKNYFRRADTPGVFAGLDAWIRRRLRMVYLKQWKRGTTCFERLRALGVPPVSAASSSDGSRGYWPRAGTRGMNAAFPQSHFDALGLTRLAA